MTENRLSPKKQNQIIQKAVKDSIEGMFPMESGGRRIVLKNVSFEDTLSDTDFPAQKETKLNRKS